MKCSRLFGLLFLAMTITVSARSDQIANPAGFQIRRGTNLSHWLSQCPRGLDKASYITEQDIAFIRGIGYDHVRIPVDEVELWSADGKRIDASFRLLTSALDWCRKHDLRAIVDLHTVRTHHFNSEYGPNTLWTDPAAQAKFLKLWEDLSSVLRPYPVAWVAYEIMNEPVADNPEDWNALVAKSVTDIRSREPKRVIVIGSNRWQSAGTFPVLKVPANDPNLILSFHDYAPFAFTHHEASWVAFHAYRGPVHYPGRTITQEELAAITDPAILKELPKSSDVWDRARMEREFKPAVDKAKELHLQLYCGEFGCMPTVLRQDRLAWYADMVATLEANGIAWANWEYKAREFGIVPYDFEKAKSAAPDAGLIHALLPESAGVPLKLGH